MPLDRTISRHDLVTMPPHVDVGSALPLGWSLARLSKPTLFCTDHVAPDARRAPRSHA